MVARRMLFNYIRTLLLTIYITSIFLTPITTVSIHTAKYYPQSTYEEYGPRGECQDFACISIKLRITHMIHLQNPDDIVNIHIYSGVKIINDEDSDSLGESGLQYFVVKSGNVWFNLEEFRAYKIGGLPDEAVEIVRSLVYATCVQISLITNVDLPCEDIANSVGKVSSNTPSISQDYGFIGITWNIPCQCIFPCFICYGFYDYGCYMQLNVEVMEGNENDIYGWYSHVASATVGNNCCGATDVDDVTISEPCGTCIYQSDDPNTECPISQCQNYGGGPPPCDQNPYICPTSDQILIG